jgi:hypothetical protein
MQPSRPLGPYGSPCSSTMLSEHGGLVVDAEGTMRLALKVKLFGTCARFKCVCCQLGSGEWGREGEAAA